MRQCPVCGRSEATWGETPTEFYCDERCAQAQRQATEILGRTTDREDMTDRLAYAILTGDDRLRLAP